MEMISSIRRRKLKFKVRTSFLFFVFFKGSNRAKESEILRCVWLRKLCTVRRVLDFHPRTEMSVLRMQFMEYRIISRKLCARDGTTVQSPIPTFLARKKCLQCSSSQTCVCHCSIYSPD